MKVSNYIFFSIIGPTADLILKVCLIGRKSARKIFYFAIEIFVSFFAVLSLHFDLSTLFVQSGSVANNLPVGVLKKGLVSCK